MTPRSSAVPALLIWASVIVFAVHNLEETLGMEAWAAARFSPSIARRYRRGPFFVASGLLSILYAALAALAVTTRGETVSVVFSVAFAAIVANGILHVGAWPLLGGPPPGFWSALTLVLPLGGWFGWRAIAEGSLTVKQAIFLLLAGAVLQSPLAFCATAVSNFLFDLVKRPNAAAGARGADEIARAISPARSRTRDR